ncbi:MAG: LysM peptidoglycan-binding domain-containing protein, partial [Candidatus Moranbacteria bacterium]|nr:LysM peptidoglycan-binding domain-containing protein [Candidatus Moranbacteria bacterium]
MKWQQMILLCVTVLFGAQVAQAGQTDFYRVKPGDTLSTVFGKDTNEVCELNKKLGTIKSCDRIYPKQLLQLPKDVVAPEVTRTIVRAVDKSVTRSETNVFYWKHVGGAPLFECGNRGENQVNEEAWTTMGLTGEEKSELRKLVLFQQHQYRLLKPGDTFQAVAFCKNGQVAFEQNAVAAWSNDLVVPARTYVLKSGKVLYWVRNCNNWVVGQPLPPVVVPPVVIPPADVPPVVTPPAEEPPVVTPADEPPAEEERAPVCLLNPSGVIGQEIEPEHQGDDADSKFL